MATQAFGNPPNNLWRIFQREPEKEMNKCKECGEVRMLLLVNLMEKVAGSRNMKL